MADTDNNVSIEVEPEKIELSIAGRPLTARLFRAAMADEPNVSRPVVVIVPALGTPAGVYRRFAVSLAACHVNVFLADLRGVGDSPFRASRGTGWGYVDLVDDDLQQMVTAARLAVPAAPVFLLGHSLGAQLSLLFVARHQSDSPLAGVICCAAGSPFWRTFRGWRRWQVRWFAGVVRVWSLLFGQFHGEWLGFGGHQPARLMREWAGFCRTGTLRDIEGTALSDTIREVKLPFLGIDLAGDNLAPARSMDALQALTSCQSQRWHLDALPDGSLPQHFAWLKQPDPVAARVAHFVLDPTAAPPVDVG